MTQLLSNFDVSHITLGDEIKYGKVGNSFLPFTSRIEVQFGKGKDDMMNSRFGLSKPFKNESGDKLNLEFTPTEVDASKLAEMDNFFREQVNENGRAWFKKDKKFEYKPLLSVDNDGRNIAKVKVIVRAEDKITDVYQLDDEDNIVKKDSDALKTCNSKVCIIAKSTSMWFSNGQCGVSFNAVAIVVRKSQVNSTSTQQWADTFCDLVAKEGKDF